MASWQTALLKAWYAGAWWLWLLRPLEFLFRGFAWLRRAGFQYALFESYRAPVPVVVVGNITLGGTGKTPVVIALVEALQAKGIRVGVVSRGYGSSGSSFPHSVSKRSDAKDCGDEPLLIHLRTGCAVVVAPKRTAAVKALLADSEVDLVLCDDGLQHYALQRDYEVVVLDEKLRVGNGFCIPAGPLREAPGRLQHVDYLLFRGSDDKNTGVSYDIDGLISLRDGEAARLGGEAIHGAVHAMAGIGQPEQFFASLESAGLNLEKHVFADHHSFDRADIESLSGKPIIMTEKDAVKCREFARDDCWYLKISAQVPARLISAVAELARR